MHQVDLNKLGSKPKVHAPRQVNLPGYHNSNADIAGSRSRQLHIGLNKPHYAMTNADLPGSQPDCVKFKTTREPANPLAPKYKLQTFKIAPVPPPKFIRDGITVEGIDGAKPKKERQFA